MKAPSKTLERFRINISDEVLNDLRARLKATRFAPDLDNGLWIMLPVRFHAETVLLTIDDGTTLPCPLLMVTLVPD